MLDVEGWTVSVIRPVLVSVTLVVASSVGLVLPPPGPVSVDDMGKALAVSEVGVLVELAEPTGALLL